MSMKVWTAFQEVESSGDPDILYTKIQAVAATRDTAKQYVDRYYSNIKWHDYEHESKGETALGNGQRVRIYVSEHELIESVPQVN